jgi:hypothetical protein
LLAKTKIQELHAGKLPSGASIQISARLIPQAHPFFHLDSQTDQQNLVVQAQQLDQESPLLQPKQ